MYDTQKSYETVRKWFSRPNAVYGITDADNCIYRNNGCRCAIGCQIPKKLYDPRLEGMGILQVLFWSPEIFEFFKAVDREWLIEVQDLHDDLARARRPLNIFIMRLDNLAAGYGLKLVRT